MKNISFKKTLMAVAVGALFSLTAVNSVSAQQNEINHISVAQQAVAANQHETDNEATMNTNQNIYHPHWARTTDNQEIYYEDTKGNGPVLFFHSGYMGIHDIWLNQVKALGQNYRVITHDRRGYGQSSSPEDVKFYSVDRNVEDMKAVMDAAGITSPVYIVTHSMGGTDAIAFAIKYPARVKGIITAGGATLSGETGIKMGWTNNTFADGNKTPEDSMNFFHKLGLRSDIAAEAGKWSRHTFVNQTAAFLNYKTDKKAATIQAPVLVLQGEKDVVTPLAHSQEIVDTLPHARLQMVPGAIHFPPTETPDQLNNIIEKFVMAHP